MKKILLFAFLGLLVFLVVKGLFFSGITQHQSYPTHYKKAPEPGYVWASAGAQYQRGAIGEFLLGQHYRDIWNTPVKAPILDLEHMHGGFKVGKLGGGQQTTSLNLTSSSGQTFALRSLDKDPIEILTPFWRRTFIADLIRDQISAANPYAALVVADLAEAAHIPHTNPQVVFISDADEKLKAYQTQLGNKLFLLEEKYTWRSLAHFPDAATIVNSVDMLDNRYRYQLHQIDQKAYARCRLFDILIGDWDRHEGQWNWAAYPAGENIIYKPIPKDRDQAFSQYQDGLIPWLLTRDFAMRKFGHFAPAIHVKAYTVNASFIDERALNALTLTDFKNIALSLQQDLSVEEIEQAVRKFPEPVFKKVGPETANILKSRTQALLPAALEFYQLLAKKIVIAGTDEREKFEVTRLDDAHTTVKIYQVSETDSIGKLWYSRTFKTSETEEITLHGLAGDDIFVVTGPAKDGIKLSIIGGLGEDQIQDYTLLKDKRKRTVVYDTRTGNDIIWSPNMINKTSSDISVHNYDREGY